MDENQNINKNKKCLTSISFSVIGSFIIIFESISLIMSILCLAVTSWNFLRKFIKILNVMYLIIITLAIIMNILLFINIKNIRFDIVKKFQNRMIISFLLLFIYLILIIFSIFNSIYLSIRLHIADYPEYGGRKRDQNYIDTHPDEFGDVPLKQFVIVGFCPAIISILNLICFMLCILFRQKMINTYDKMRYEDDKKENEITAHKHKNKHSKRKTSKRKYSNEIINTNDVIIKNNNTDPNIERNGKGVNKDKNLIQLKINNTDDGEEYKPKNRNSKLIIDDHIVETRETLNEGNKLSKYKNSKINIINSMQGTKSSMNDKEKEEIQENEDKKENNEKEKT